MTDDEMWNTRYGHSIKNPHIIHVVEEYEYLGEIRFGYICCHQQLTPEKVATSPEEVSCKNCLRKMGEL